MTGSTQKISNKRVSSQQPAKTGSARNLKPAAEAMLRDLARSGMTERDAARMQLAPLSTDEVRERTKKKDKGDSGIYSSGGYAVPYFDVNGKPIAFTRLRLFESKLKYWQASNTAPRVYFPIGRNWARINRDNKIPIIAVEGEKKSYRGSLEEGLNVLGIGGVWSFQSKRLGRPLLRDLDAIDWSGRVTFICYDSDAADNDGVASAEERFAEELARRGAVVKIIRLTAASDGSKRGLDDFLEQEDRKAFDELIESAEPYVDRFAELNRECAVIIESGDILTLANGSVYSYGKFKNVIGAIYSQHVLTPTGTKDISLVPSWLASRGHNAVEAMIFEPAQYDPDSPYVIAVDGKRYYNRYRGRDIEPDAGDITPWFELFQHVFGNAAESHRTYVLDMLAFKAQFPGARLNLSLLVIGGQGIGKSLLLETYGMTFGRYYREVTNDDLHSPYTGDWLMDALVILGNELTRRGHNDTADAGRVKNLTTNATHKINNKFGAKFSQANHTFFILTTENPNPLKTAPDERRYYIHNALNAVKPVQPSLVKRLRRWRDEQNGIAYLLDWLLKRKISAKFDPTAPAWESEGKRMVAVTSEDYFERTASELENNERILWDMPALLAHFNPRGEYKQEIAEKRIIEAAYRVGARRSKKTRLSKDPKDNKHVWVFGKNTVERFSKPNADLRGEWERFAALPKADELTTRRLEKAARKAAIETGKVADIAASRRKQPPKYENTPPVKRA